MSERPASQDPDRDPALDRAYRASDRDEPPTRLDEAIRAAARREVGARPQPSGGGGLRTWRVPVSIAAMLVVGVSVVTLVREEHPQVLEVPPPGPAVQAPATEVGRAQEPLGDQARERSPAAAADARRDQAAVTRQIPAQATPEAKLATPPSVVSEEAAAPLKRERRIEQDALTSPARNAAIPPEVQRPAPQAFGTPEPRETEAARASAEQSRSAPAAGAAAADSAVRAAPRPALRADSALPAAPSAAPMAEGRMAPLAKAQADGNYPGLDTPEQWLARIRDLRKQGRLPEAAKLLAEFRQRYPAYTLPQDLLEGVKP